MTSRGVPAHPISSCPVCGGSGVPLYSGLEDRAYSVLGKWGFNHCTSCQSLWLTPQPLLEADAQLYPEHYEPHQAAASPPKNLPWCVRKEREWQAGIQTGLVASRLGYSQLHTGRRWRLLGRLAWSIRPVRDNAAAMIMFAGKPGLLLDIGCGDGRFMELMASLGWKVSGVEPNLAAVRVATQRVGSSIVHATFEDARLPFDTYDLVTMGHVLEHMRNPLDALRKARALLKRNGRLVITTPNVMSLGHRIFRSAWRHLDPPRHMTLFTMNSLTSAIKRAGLVVQYRTSLTRTAWWVAAQSAAIRRGQPLRPVEELTPALWPRIFALAQSAFSLLSRTSGEELLVVAARPTGKTGP